MSDRCTDSADCTCCHCNKIRQMARAEGVASAAGYHYALGKKDGRIEAFRDAIEQAKPVAEHQFYNLSVAKAAFQKVVRCLETLAEEAERE